jgi:branched-chain amino acid transport system substrate-binding protein
MRLRLTTIGAAALALAAFTAASATAAPSRANADPGVTATSILVGGTAPLTGPASSYSSIARAADAYFKYVNAKGGVNGRSIEYKYLDDAYNPLQTVQVVRQLVEQDRVFAIFNTLGTSHNLAIRDYLRQQGVPQLFVASGATTWGRDVEQYPGIVGLQPSYQAEGWIYGKYLARTLPGSRVAVIFQNDEYGKDLLVGLKAGLRRSKVKVVAAQPYEVQASDVQSQIAKLKSSGADVLFIAATPTFAIQSFVFANKLGWKPKQTIVNAVASAANIVSIASEGGANKVVPNTISIAFQRDPTDPKWKNDAGIKLYREILAKYAPGANPNDTFHVYGMAAAWTFVEALKRAGGEPTRESIVKAVSSMNFPGNPFLLPGIDIKTGPGDHFPIERVLLQRWGKNGWRTFGGLWGYRAS